MPAILFMDTETTGLSLDDDIWEFAAIRREEDGTETEHHLFIHHDERKCRELPDSFRKDHLSRWPGAERATPRGYAARFVQDLTADRPHIVGAVPNFDTERLTRLLGTHGCRWGGHYHLIDVENLAVGYLHGRRFDESGEQEWSNAIKDVGLPWSSDELSRALGVEPPTDQRHTAMGDARWVRAMYDAMVHTLP